TEALSEGSWPLRVESGSRPSGGFLLRPLTVKLRGRTTASDRRRGPTISPWTRGAKQITHHGPLQRLLDVAGTALLCHWRATEVFRGFSRRDSRTEIDLAVAGGIPRFAIHIVLVVRDRELVRSAAGMPGANSLQLIRDHS